MRPSRIIIREEEKYRCLIEEPYTFLCCCDTPDEQLIINTFSTTADTAKAILKLAQELNIPKELVTVTSDSIQKQKVEDVKGADFGKLIARTTKVKKKSITVKWKKVPKADGYMLFGNKCGNKNKYKLLKEFNANQRTYTQKKLKSGVSYKYLVIAYKVVNGQKVTIAAAKTLHCYTLSKKAGYVKALKVNKKKVSMKKGKKFKIKAKEITKGRKWKRHRKVAYESLNPKVATVSAKGKVKGISKGTGYIYVYAQNGIFKRIKVTVK